MTEYYYFAFIFFVVAVIGLLYDWEKKLGWWMLMGCAVVLVFLPGCAGLSQERPSDWPKLEVSYTYVDFVTMQRKCQIPLAASVLIQCFGYSEPDFCNKTCKVTLFTDLMREHERGHCEEGRDHPNSTFLADKLAYYRKHGRYECRFKLGQERYCKLHNDREICG